eukprot:TRINITY_DN9374_c0_g1_i1.p2 TRINITY_DN9374_c0_g1~~TRINITY_DN9374_c0_g1_i1.p2  ORF type:complete len:187 (-),score=33.63 TRINITY_DN9374_c0_g1_i1:180-740(-)
MGRPRSASLDDSRSRSRGPDRKVSSVRRRRRRRRSPSESVRRAVAAAQPAARSRSRGGRQFCKDYRRGECDRGDGCRFSHDFKPAISPPRGESRQGGRQDSKGSQMPPLVVPPLMAMPPMMPMAMMGMAPPFGMPSMMPPPMGWPPPMSHGPPPAHSPQPLPERPSKAELEAFAKRDQNGIDIDDI